MVKFKDFFAVFTCFTVFIFLSYGQETVNPVVEEHFPIRNLSWDSTDSLFAYIEQDIIFLRNLDEYKLIGVIDFPGVLNFSLYYEDDSDVQIIAGSADGTFAVWSLLGFNPPPIQQYWRRNFPF